MEFIFELLGQFLGEFLLQAIIELLVEVGAHTIQKSPPRPLHPVVAGLGYMLWGALAGALSLLLLPHSAIANPALRMVNLAVTPVLMGAVMSVVGKARERRGRGAIRLDRFGYGFLFAFSMSLVRFVWAA